MAKSTYLQLCQDTRRECGISGTGPATVYSQIGVLENVVKWVQYSAVEIEGRWPNWDFLHVDGWSAPTDNGLIVPPADIGVWDEDSFYVNSSLSTWWKLGYIPYQEWRDTLRNGTVSSGKPSTITIKPSRELALSPIPNTTYTISADYWRKPKKLTENNDTSYVPEEYERIIVTRAVMLYAIDHGAIELIGSTQVEYDDLLDKLEAMYLPGQSARRMMGGNSMVVRPQ